MTILAIAGVALLGTLILAFFAGGAILGMSLLDEAPGCGALVLFVLFFLLIFGGLVLENFG